MSSRDRESVDKFRAGFVDARFSLLFDLILKANDVMKYSDLADDVSVNNFSTTNNALKLMLEPCATRSYVTGGSITPTFAVIHLAVPGNINIFGRKSNLPICVALDTICLLRVKNEY